MKPKRLNLQEITKLYLLLKPAIDKSKDDDTVGDTVYTIIKDTDSKALLECIHIMYDNSIEFSEFEEFISLFVESLHVNDFFGFVSFIKGISDGVSRQ